MTTNIRTARMKMCVKVAQASPGLPLANGIESSPATTSSSTRLTSRGRAVRFPSAASCDGRKTASVPTANQKARFVGSGMYS
jgi:hypothetical protein